MRLHLADDALEPDLLATATLNNIGHQLACSIEIGQLIGDLQRREIEDRGLYDVLVRMSSQKPMVETLDALAHHARDLLDASSVEIWLSPQSAALIDVVGREPSSDSLSRTADGGATIAVRANAAGGVAAADSDKPTARMSLVSPELTLGELRVVARDEQPFADREWRFLHRIAELAVIAITSARMRDRDRQVAILAERERLAREMHDSLAQVLGFIHLQLQALRAKVARVEFATDERQPR